MNFNFYATRFYALLLFGMFALNAPVRAQNIYSVVGNGVSGTPADGVPAISSSLVNANGVAFDTSGNMYVCDVNDHTIRKVNLTTGIITTIAGIHGVGGFTGDGGAATSARINYPANIIFDPSGNLYFSDLLGNRIRKITPGGIISTYAGTGSTGSSGDGGAATSATFNQPVGLAVDKLGNLYVSEISGHRIRKITPGGIISTFAGTGTASSTGDGSAAASATFNKPRGIMFDTSDNLYIVEEAGHRVRMINTSGIVSTIAGTGTPTSTGDGGLATAATVSSPRGITQDHMGNIFFTEGGGSRVRKIDPSGIISTFAGTGTYGLSGDGGPATSATIKFTMDIAMFRNNIYFTDYDAANVRMICTGGPAAPTVSTPLVTFCQGSSATALSATGYTLAWYTTPSGGTALSGTPTPSTGTAEVKMYYVSQTYFNAGCESPRVPVQVTINPRPDSVFVNPLSALSFCAGDSVVLLANNRVKMFIGTTPFFTSTGRTDATVPCNCPTGYVAVGYSGGTGVILDGVSLICKPLDRFGILGSTTVTTTRNGGGGGAAYGPYTFSGNEALVGAFLGDAYFSTAYQLNQLRGYGQSIASIKALMSNTTSPVSLTMLSGVGGNTTTNTLWAPDGCVITGMTGSADPFANSIAFQYTPIGAFQYSYSWSNGDTNDHIIVRNSGSFSFTVTNSLGCSATSAPVTITSNAMPLPIVDTASPEICLGQSVTITASAASLGNALDFNGSKGNYASVPNSASISLTGSTNFTVSGWVYPRSNKHQNILFHGLGCSSWASWNLGIGGFEAGNEWWPKKLGFSFMTVNGGGINYVAATDTIIPNQWVHVAASYDGSKLRLYINGVLNNTATASGAPWNSPEKLYIGYDPGCGGRVPYNGKLDEVQIWNTVRSSVEIATSYNRIASPSSTGLAAYWRFDENNGRNIYDVSTNNNIGVLTGAVTREIPSTAPLPAMTGSSISYTWTPATGLSGTGASVTATPTLTTDYTVTASNTTTGCSNTNVVRVKVNPLPAAPTVTSPVVYCQGSTPSALTATATVAGTTFRWYTVATGGTPVAVPTPGTATEGSTNYYVSQVITATGCEGPRALITVTVNHKPAAPVVITPVNLCHGGPSVTLTATKETASDTLYWYTLPTGGTATTVNPTPSTATVTTLNYYVSLNTSLSCEGARSAIAVNINPVPVAPSVTPTVTYCQGASPVALAAIGTNLQWYTAPTGGTASTTAPTPSTSTPGSTTWYVSQLSSAATGSCESPRSAITVVVNPSPAAPAVVTPVVYCQNAAALPLSATKALPTDTLLWYNVASGGTPAYLTPTPGTATTGTTLYYVSLKTNLGCEGLRATITVNINPLPAIPTVTTPVQLCLGGPASALTATGTGLLWYLAATGGTGSATAPTPSTLSAGSTTYYVSQTSATTTCEGPRTPIVVVVNNLPAAPTVTTPIQLCKDGPASVLTATGSNLKWYTAATGGTSGSAPTPPTTATGSTNWYVSQTSSAATGSCEGPRSAINVTVNPRPPAPTVTSPLNICIGVPAAALTATGINLKWYNTLTGGSPIGSTPVPSSSSLGTVSFYVSQTSDASVGSCEGVRATLTVTVQPSPVLTITPVGVPDFVFCQDKVVTLKATAPSAVSFQWQTLGSGIPGATFDTLNADSKQFYGVTATTIYGCKKTDSVFVKDNPLPYPVLSPTDVQQCEGVSIVLYCTPGLTGHKYEWFKEGASMGLPVTDVSTPVSTPGIYTVTVTDIYKCVRTTKPATISNYPTVEKPAIVRMDPMLKLNKKYARYQWYRNYTPLSGTGAVLSSYTMTFDGTYFCEVSDGNGCLNYSDTVEVKALSIGNQQLSSQSIRIYPNPTRNIVNIEAPVKVNIMVTDIVGKLIFKKEDARSIDLGDYADGTYMIRIFDAQNNLISVEKINKISAQ
jgi:sugar lactone lactonase YvrE